MDHQVFIPTLTHNYRPPHKGLAIAQPPADDLTRLGAEWYYNWSPYPMPGAGCQFVPMLQNGLPNEVIPSTYAGNLLVFNEPNVEAFLNLSPRQTLDRLQVLRSHYPHATLIGPGHSLWALDWIREFVRIGGRFDIWAIHAYLEGELGVEHIQGLMTFNHNLTGGLYWVTEYGDTRGRGDDFAQVTRWFASQKWITRIAPYTNRQPELSAVNPWVISKAVDLVRDDDTLTPQGEFYANWSRS